jgi:hypothetical protein
MFLMNEYADAVTIGDATVPSACAWRDPVSKPFANWEAVSEPLIAGCMFLKCDDFCGLGRYGFLESEDFGLKLGDVLGASRDRQCEEDDQCAEHWAESSPYRLRYNARSVVIAVAIGTTSQRKLT